MTITLRPDQLQGKTDIYNAWNSGARNVCFVLPTGGGKSIVISDIVYERNMLGARQVVIAHRRELVSQMSLHVGRRGIKHRIIGPNNVVAAIAKDHRAEFGRSYVDPTANCSVAGIDTLVAREQELKQWAGQIEFFYGDEGHHFLKDNKWGRGVAMFERSHGLLVTATPSRADGNGLGRHAEGIADAMVLGPDMRTLIDIGALTDYEIAIPESDFKIDDDAITPSGDYSQKKMREASQKSHIVGDVVTEYAKRAFGKRAICFATDVETAIEIANRFKMYGIPAAAVSAKTPSETRNEMIRRFRDGRVWILVNVDLFGEGFDVPACEVVIMARPTASLAVYLQQFGRALRPIFGKAFGLIIDHVSNWKRHGFPDKPHYWTLDRRERKSRKQRDPEELELTACRHCSKPYLRALPACPHCGATPPLPEPGGRSIETVDGDLILLDRDKLEQLRKSVELKSAAQVQSQAGHATGNDFAARGAFNKQMEKIKAQGRLRDAIDQWAGIQRHKGRSDQETYRRFYLTVGVDVLSAQALPGDEMNALAERVEGWYST